MRENEASLSSGCRRSQVGDVWHALGVLVYEGFCSHSLTPSRLSDGYRTACALEYHLQQQVRIRRLSLGDLHCCDETELNLASGTASGQGSPSRQPCLAVLLPAGHRHLCRLLLLRASTLARPPFALLDCGSLHFDCASLHFRRQFVGLAVATSSSKGL